MQSIKLKILSLLYQMAGTITGIWDPVQSAIFGVEAVTRNFEPFGPKFREDKIQLVKGLFEDTLMVENEVTPAHVECDWSGCRDATDDFFKDIKDKYSFETIGDKLHIKKLAE